LRLKLVNSGRLCYTA